MITGLKRRVRGGLGRLFLMALKDPEVQRDLWKSVNRPEPGNNGSRALAVDPWVALWESASRDTARCRLGSGVPP